MTRKFLRKGDKFSFKAHVKGATVLFPDGAIAGGGIEIGAQTVGYKQFTLGNEKEFNPEDEFVVTKINEANMGENITAHTFKEKKKIEVNFYQTNSEKAVEIRSKKPALFPEVVIR